MKLELLKECWKCYGSRFDSGVPDSCKQCDGTGSVSTEDGEELLQFLKRFGVIKDQNETV